MPTETNFISAETSFLLTLAKIQTNIKIVSITSNQNNQSKTFILPLIVKNKHKIGNLKKTITFVRTNNRDMAKNLVIVESPAKAKTIEKFLGKEYQVESSYGHIADLPSKEIGVDVTNGFKPKYEVSPDKKALVKKLKDLFFYECFFIG